MNLLQLHVSMVFMAGDTRSDEEWDDKSDEPSWLISTSWMAFMTSDARSNEE